MSATDDLLVDSLLGGVDAALDENSGLWVFWRLRMIKKRQIPRRRATRKHPIIMPASSAPDVPPSSLSETNRASKGIKTRARLFFCSGISLENKA